MKKESILTCLIAFVLGFFVAHMMRGNQLMVGATKVHHVHNDAASSEQHIEQLLDQQVNMMDSSGNYNGGNDPKYAYYRDRTFTID